ncbi:hypothetical protein ONZ51_g9904 [Trametes cubensis]|uniref:SUN domain-containing protein n=1 Tax=Trametes cubensis TaxID=1111947 RepID=A0AAD7TKY6_9APHY|nr:hypothetical protein ONZ51_g9904 [Trametes cubensis]
MVLRYVECNRLCYDQPTGVTCLAFSPCGKYLATGALNGNACIWSISDGRLLHVLSGAIPMLSIAWDESCSNTVMCGLQDGTVACLIISPSGLQVIGFWAHSYPVECLSLKRGFLASGAHEEVRIWSRKDREWVREVELPPPPKTSFNRVLDIVVTSIHWMVRQRGKPYLLVTYLDHGVHIFDAVTWKQDRTVPISGQIADSSISNDGKLIAISNVISGFEVYALDVGTALWSFGHTVTDYRKIPVLFIHGAAAIVGGNLQGDVHLWDVSSGRKLHSLVHAKDDQIFALAAYYDAELDNFFIATGILRGTSGASVILWKAEELGISETSRSACSSFMLFERAFATDIITGTSGPVPLITPPPIASVSPRVLSTPLHVFHMSFSLRELLLLVLLMSWLSYLYRYFLQSPRPSQPVYSFTARTPICQDGTTVLEFSAPSAPHGNRNVVPTILRTLDALDVVGASGVASGRAQLPTQLASVNLKEEKPVFHLKTEPRHRVASMRTPSVSRNTVLHIEPILHPQVGVDNIKTLPYILSARVTRSMSRSSLASAPEASVPDDNGHGGGHPPANMLHLASATANSNDRIFTEDDGVSTSLPYYKRELKPHTAWFGSKGTQKISQPPIMCNQHEVRVGDVFRHLAPDAVQLWLWEAAQGEARWRRVHCGFQREDGRYLSVTEKKKEPSWVCSEWCYKRISALKHEGLVDIIHAVPSELVAIFQPIPSLRAFFVFPSNLRMSGGSSPFDPSRFVFEEPPKRAPARGKTVRFEQGDPSFSEQVTRTHHVRPKPHYRALKAPRISLSRSTHLLIAGSLFVLALALLYLPFSSLDRPITDTNPSHFIESGSKLLTAVWPFGHKLQAAPTPSPTSLDSERDLIENVAIRAQWGPVLRPDYALRANGGRIVQTLTTPLQSSRSASSASTLGPEIVIDEDVYVGRCWTIAVTGQIGISTSVLIHPRYITIDHIPRQVALDIGRAPRRMVLWGVIDGLSNIQRFRSLVASNPNAETLLESGPCGRSFPPISGTHAFFALATFEYDVYAGFPSQTFAVSDYIAVSGMDFGIFVVEVIDNWGAADTCLYRIRIHGEPAAVLSKERNP